MRGNESWQWLSATYKTKHTNKIHQHKPGRDNISTFCSQCKHYVSCSIKKNMEVSEVYHCTGKCFRCFSQQHCDWNPVIITVMTTEMGVILVVTMFPLMTWIQRFKDLKNMMKKHVAHCICFGWPQLEFWVSSLWLGHSLTNNWEVDHQYRLHFAERRKS